MRSGRREFIGKRRNEASSRSRRASARSRRESREAARRFGGVQLESLEARWYLAADISVGSPQGGAFIEIVDGDATPSFTDRTDLGSTTLGGAASQWTFRVRETGGTDVLLFTGNPTVQFSGPDAAAFLTNGLPAGINAGGFVDFVIAFDPTHVGLHHATVTIQSNDPDEGVYTFDIQGTGVAQRLDGAVEDADFVITHAMMQSAVFETGTSAFRIESVEAGVLLKGGVAVTPGVTTVSAGESLTWQPPADVNRTVPAFTVKQFDGGNVFGDNIAIRVEITPAEDDPTGEIDDLTLLAPTSESINLAALFADADTPGTVVRMQTVLGDIDIHLFDSATPATVANFLSYDYANTIIHRSIAGFITQGGGFLPQVPATHIPTNAPVVNEFGIANLRGTIAMAKVGNLPDSATSEWFFNLGDNTTNLDNQNAGFTVFAEVVGDGMDVVDAIAAVPTFNGAGFADVPLRNFAGGVPTDDNWVFVHDVSEIDALSFEVVGNTNPALVTATESDGELDLHFAPGETGDSDITVRVTDVTGRQIMRTFTVSVIEPTTVSAMIVNGGDAQRSMVSSVAFAFNAPVSLSAAALEVMNVTTGEIVSPGDMMMSYDPATQTATWTFPGLPGGTLGDGNYELNLTAAAVTDAAGSALDGDGDGNPGGNHAATLFRYFGDADGDRDVDFTDVFNFRAALQTTGNDPGYDPRFDSDNDNDVDVIDLFAFRGNLQSVLDPPADGSQLQGQQSQFDSTQSGSTTSSPTTLNAVSEPVTTESPELPASPESPSLKQYYAAASVYVFEPVAPLRTFALDLDEESEADASPLLKQW